ncbi:MAG: Crp/Fnr family transcriptional regulator [Actinomycetota bacterium]|nr:Crp/Fnr family transcriptional regulator [Actinomycetota bacterium]
MDRFNDQHAAWLARTFGRTEYLPITREDATALASAGVMIDKYKGTHLFREGAASDAAYVVHSGEIELYRTTGTTKNLIARLGPGAVVGDIAVFQDRPYLSSARAVQHSRVLRLPRETLMPLLVTRPMIAMRWLVAGLAQLESTQRSLLRLMNRTVLEQVADLLVSEQDEYGEVRLSQGSMAELLGASRQSVNEAIAVLKSSGSVETGYRLIRIIDSDAVVHASTCQTCKEDSGRPSSKQRKHAFTGR